MRSCSGYRRSRFLYVFLCLLSLLQVSGVRGQSIATGGVETATQDRLDDPGWWPTKGDYPRSSFAGDATCERCHAGLFRTQITTPMANAARLAKDSHLLNERPLLSFENGPYSYRLTSTRTSIEMSVTNGRERESTPLTWAFGSGELGQTYVYEQDGRWFESRLSLYTKSGQLDITTGHGRGAPERVHDALGRGMKDVDARHCFACHTSMSTTGGHFEPGNATPGVSCEACHGPGEEHAKAMASGKTTKKGSSLLNPARMSPVDSVDFCGACHRTWADVAFSGGPKRGIEVVRFQPYRLQKSRCWGKAGDARLSCVACHDPHAPLERDAASYDTQCLSCHLRDHEVATANKVGAACPRGTDHCTTCHMPKTAVPEMHGEFTDHFIRVVSPDGVIPE